MNVVVACRSFYEFSASVCGFITQCCSTKARVRCLPAVDQRTFSGTPHFEGPHFQHRRSRDSAGQSTPGLRTAVFISDKQLAHHVIEASGLSTSSDGYKVVIFHMNPGDGMLAESLLKSCGHKQIAWEPRKVYWDYMESLTELYNTRFAYCSRSFARDSELKKFDEVFSNDECADLTRYHVKIVGNVPEMDVIIPRLAVSLGGAYNFRLGRFGIVEPILIVTGREYRLMTEPEQLWRSSRNARVPVYGLFLSTELLKTAPLSAFNNGKHFVLKYANFDYDRENFYVVRLSLRNDSMCSHEEIVGIISLLDVMNSRRARRVIPEMECLCPDIGLTLLELGISMMDRCCDIPTNMWPEIYRAIVRSSQFSFTPLYHILKQKELILMQLERELQ